MNLAEWAIRRFLTAQATIEGRTDADRIQPANEGELPAEPGNDLAADMTTPTKEEA